MNQIEKKYALLKGGIVENVVLSAEREPLDFLIPSEYEIVEETEETGPAFFGGTLSDGRFLPPQPYPSWTLAPERTYWIAPKDVPEEYMGKITVWDEDKLDWVLVEV
jgi:hypothetical protein